MIFEHLSIEQLSDFIDNDILAEEKELILEHIRVCELCRCEYESLNRCVMLISGLRNEVFQIPDLSEKTLLICRSRERKRLYIRSIPAIAASVMIIGVAGIIKTGYYTDNRAYVAATMPVQNETQIIISTIRDSNGRIMRMSSSFIDGEVESSSLANLESTLRKNNIKYYVAPVNYNETIVKNNNLTDAGLTSGAPEYKPVQKYGSKASNKVTVRFFK